MELVFCVKEDARAVLVLYKYCSYFHDFVGICFDLVHMWRQLSSFRKNNTVHWQEEMTALYFLTSGR